MNRLSPEERISAYLDGELSADEAQSVESLLRDRDDLRQLHDELLAVRASLKALYRHRLDANFSERVLRKAERAVLSLPAADDHPPLGAAGAATAEFSDNGSAPSVRLPRPFASVRSWLWAGVAVAAAVLLLVNQPADEGSQHGIGGNGPLAARSEENPASTRHESLGPVKAAFKAQDKNEKEADQVVQHDFMVSRHVIQGGMIERLLAENQIAMETKDIEKARPGKSTDDPQQLSLVGGPTDQARRQFDVIYVEGTPRQVEALLSALRSPAGVSRLNASHERADAPADRAGVEKLAGGTARRPMAKKTKPKSKSAVGRAWRNAREARSLTQSYYRLTVPEAASQKKADSDPALAKGDEKGIAAAESSTDGALPKAAATNDAPALVTVKLVLRLVEEKPPAASAKPGK